MADNQIRDNLRPGLQCVVNGMRMPHHVLKGATAIVGRDGCPSAWLIRNSLNAIDSRGLFLRHERDPMPLPDQLTGNHSKLGWEVLVKEHHVHRRPTQRKTRRNYC